MSLVRVYKADVVPPWVAEQEQLRKGDVLCQSGGCPVSPFGNHHDADDVGVYMVTYKGPVPPEVVES